MESKLAPPGAGIPFAQRLFLRFWMGPRIAARVPREKARANYEAAIHKLIERGSQISPEARNKRVLVKPLPGLEDSSRYWSLNELIEHILIVNRGIESTIDALSRGIVPEGTADTAKLKPRGGSTDRLAEFVAEAPGALKRIDEKMAQSGGNFNSPTRFPHPWFGPFTARQWYWLMGAHAGIHCRQAKEIIAGLQRQR